MQIKRKEKENPVRHLDKHLDEARDNLGMKFTKDYS
jgi:hypothetical protein